MTTHNITAAIIAALGLAGASVAGELPPTAPYNPEMVTEDLRVVLVRLDRTTTFSTNGFRMEDNTEIHAIPGVTVVYLVEDLRRGPKRKWSYQKSVMYVQGKEVSEVAANLSAGGSSVLLEYDSPGWASPAEKPKVRDARRALVHKEWHRGIRMPSGKLDLHIKVSADGEEKEFVFKDVPVE
jgi:hypothetical protein